MNAPASFSRRLRTGVFEIDLDSGQMHKNGRRLPPQEQPFRVLAMLLENPGEVVTREQLQTRLWPADTYVSFDDGLNTAIRKLRVAFGDSADSPRFIETLPRRGYCFIAPVNQPPSPDGLSVPGAEGAVLEPLVQATLIQTKPPEVPVNLTPLAAAVRSWSWKKRALPMGAATVLILALALYQMHLRSSPRPVAPPARAMLAILPFQNLSNDPTQEYFSDGLTEETITDLGQLSPAQLGVIARTSAMAYKHTDKTISQIGRELGVDYVLEGSVRRENGRARISAQLIRVSDQTHLWAQSYDDRNMGDLLDVQNAIGRAIAEQVQVNIVPQRQAQMSKIRPVNPEAYDLYLQGRFYWNQRTPTALRESVRLFQRSIGVDPDFALAYAGLADAYNIGNIVGLYSSKESLPEAREAATKAIQLDPTLAEAHAALGMEKSHYEFDFPGAKAEFLKAIDLNPNSAYAHLFYSNCYLMPMAQRAEAIAENKRALALDPLSLPINNFMGETYLLAGDYTRSYQQFERTIAMEPNFSLPHVYLAGLFEVMGRFMDSINERETGDVLAGWAKEEASERAGGMRKALKIGREKGYWKERLAQDLHTMKKPGIPFAADILAGDYALAGEKDQAFEWLEKAYEAGEGAELTLLAVDPKWQNLRGDPRFSELLRRLGLPE